MTLLDDEFLTAKETQRLLRISESTMSRRIADGTVPSCKVGGRRLIPRSAIEALIADAVGNCQHQRAGDLRTRPPEQEEQT